eukprot:TRINITY_DN1229_c0_g1_i1.p1 TRINITY_DN1229_c0_g1~~TRINITY_DN1229_c0_g1_i1.p1  ORF type:complete len:219 (-),score=46.08 TRINITY_DN1229_c0_g1_i1:71-727(-)
MQTSNTLPATTAPFYQWSGHSFSQTTGSSTSPTEDKRADWCTRFYAPAKPEELNNLRLWFDSVDKDRSGSITAEELSSHQLFSRPLGMDVARKLIKVFDQDKSGTIDFIEYASLHNFMMQMLDAFFKSDVDKNGILDANEIQSAIKAGGFELSLSTVQFLVKKFDKKQEGVDFGSFLMLTAHLAHLRSLFWWNDRDGDGKLVLNLDQLSHLCTEMLIR